MITKFENILKELKELTLFETIDLIKEIEKFFNIDATELVAHVAHNFEQKIPEKNEEPIEEKTTFNIILSEVPSDKKIAILKAVRTITGLGLKESKDIVDNVPKIIKEGVNKEEAESIKKELESVGAKVLLK